MRQGMPRHKVNDGWSANKVDENKNKDNGGDDNTLLSFARRPEVLRDGYCDQKVDNGRN